jgi:hypothetical protein
MVGEPVWPNHLAVVVALAVAPGVGPGFSLDIKSRAEGATTLPKAGVKAQPERLKYRRCFCRCLFSSTPTTEANRLEQTLDSTRIITSGGNTKSKHEFTCLNRS